MSRRRPIPPTPVPVKPPLAQQPLEPPLAQQPVTSATLSDGMDSLGPEFHDDALEIAYRLVGIKSGRVWDQVRTRDGREADRQLPVGLAATLAARLESGQAGAVVAISCGIAIAAAEVSGSAFGVIPGAAIEAVLALVLLVLFAWRPAARSARLLPVLALVALIRPIGLAAVVPKMPLLAWYALAGLPLLVSAVLAARLIAEPARDLHLRIKRPVVDVTVAAAGLLAGLVGYLLLRPMPLLAHPSPIAYVAVLVILGVFGGLLEELIFRGLVLSASIQAFGSSGRATAYAALLSTALYWGSGSIAYMFLMAVVAVAFGLALLRGASLWGIALGHGLMLATMAILAQAAPR
jgi:membrane protease YdiL (CAAX protease family)